MIDDNLLIPLRVVMEMKLSSLCSLEDSSVTEPLCEMIFRLLASTFAIEIGEDWLLSTISPPFSIDCTKMGSEFELMEMSPEPQGRKIRTSIIIRAPILCQYDKPPVSIVN